MDKETIMATLNRDIRHAMTKKLDKDQAYREGVKAVVEILIPYMNNSSWPTLKPKHNGDTVLLTKTEYEQLVSVKAFEFGIRWAISDLAEDVGVDKRDRKWA